MEQDLACRRKRLKHFHSRPICDQRSSKIHFSDLPEDVLGTILSKMAPKDIVRTSVLSNKWKRMWTVCPKLRFDGIAICGEDMTQTQNYSQKFVDNVNAILKQYHGKVVEELGIKFEFDSTVAEHLDDWVNFVLLSRAKNLALNLLPAKFGLHPDRYKFPFKLFNGETISRLQHLQLSFVSFESPSPFSGFPNLKKLHLDVVRVTREDLQDMLSSCFNLEWLSIVRCHIDELKVVCPLPHLLDLHVAHCDIRRIEFNAMNLQTFVYRGTWIPFYLGHALALRNARLYYIGDITLDFAVTSLPGLLPCVQNLTLHSFLPLKMSLLQGNNSKFSQLKYLQLSFFVLTEDINNLLYLVSLLRAAPFVEKLDINFTTCALSHCSELIKTLPQCTHNNYLKELSITGFAGCTGQVEFLVSIVEKSPNLEVLTIDRADHFRNDGEYQRRIRSKALDDARRHLNGRISQKTKVVMM